MEHCCSKILQWVSIVNFQALYQLTITVPGTYEGIVIWRTTRHKLYSFLKRSVTEFVFTLDYVVPDCIELIFVFGEMISTAVELQGMPFRPVGKLMGMHQSIIHVPSSTSTPKCLKTSNLVHSFMEPIMMVIGMLHSTFLTSWFVDHNCSFSISLMNCFQKGGG